MDFHLEQKDYMIMGVLAVLSALAGYASLMASDPLIVEQWLDRVTVLVVLSSVIVLFKAKSEFDDEMARNLELIAIGLTIYMIIYLPHIIWHVTGQNPVPLGSITIPRGFLFGFFHMLSISSFVLVGYGFYNLWVDHRE